MRAFFHLGGWLNTLDWSSVHRYCINKRLGKTCQSRVEGKGKSPMSFLNLWARLVKHYAKMVKVSGDGSAGEAPAMGNLSSNSPLEAGSTQENAWISDIYQQHGDQARRSSLYIVGQIRDAEDVLQESFLKLLRRIRKGPISHPYAYLNAVVRTTSFDLLAKRRAEPSSAIAVDNCQDRQQTDPSGPIQHQELATTLDRVIDQLDPRLAKVVIARYLNDKSYAQIADEMGISRNTARCYHWQAIQELQRVLFKD